MRRRFVLLLAALALVAACETASEEPVNEPPRDQPSQELQATEAGATQRHPDVVDAQLVPDGDAYDVEVTISSPYDSPQRYADGWRVLAPDGAVLGEHTLAHDHAGEQPFTRTQQDVEVPAGVEEVTVEGRDQRYGYGGGTVTVTVPQT